MTDELWKEHYYELSWTRLHLHQYLTLVAQGMVENVLLGISEKRIAVMEILTEALSLWP